MSKKLAIRGHESRGNEVIEILKMLGGKNNCDSPADNLGLCYLINDKFDICAHYFGYDDYEDGELNIFTLEEFLEKYPFKVGDKAVYIDDNDIVVISEIEWDNTVEDIFYKVKRIDEDDCFLCPPEVLKPFDTAANHIMRPEVNTDGMLCYKIPDGYESFSIQDGMIILKPKKPKYPETFEECLNLLYCKSILRPIIGHKAELLFNLEKLLICRDAYWKIAGEQMGLDKPWEHDWTSGKPVYCISVSVNTIGTGKWYTDNKILAFPTEEMRDAFYENFKDLIEQCKELL